MVLGWRLGRVPACWWEYGGPEEQIKPTNHKKHFKKSQRQIKKAKQINLRIYLEIKTKFREPQQDSKNSGKKILKKHFRKNK